MTDGGQGGDGISQNQQMGWDYDEGTGRADLQRRIEEIRRALDAWAQEAGG